MYGGCVTRWQVFFGFYCVASVLVRSCGQDKLAVDIALCTLHFAFRISHFAFSA
jgi:hypothetical protein